MNNETNPNQAVAAGPGARYLDRKRAAEMLGISTKTLDRMVTAGDGPPSVDLRGDKNLRRWEESALKAWAEKHKTPSPKEGAKDA